MTMSEEVPGINQSYVAGKIKIAQTFRGKPVAHDAERSNRLPPGQRLVSTFPVLDLGIQPHPQRFANWQVEIAGLVNTPQTFSLDELASLARTEITADFHCVTRWSTYDLQWEGVLLRDLLQHVGLQEGATHLIFHGFDGYTTNVSLEEAATDTGMLALLLNGEPLSREHGGPIRGIIPQLYGWKSAKFLTKITVTNHDELGFWETRGYHQHGDPWNEERYAE
jgi:DMSO/TMAO reductase YedYZ molybdopterin-dependent catalytic subunit